MGVERVDVVCVANDRLGDVAHWDPGWSSTLLGAVMGVAVQNEICAGVIDGLRHQVAPEERIDLQSLTFQRRLDRRIVQQRDSQLGVQRR